MLRRRDVEISKVTVTTSHATALEDTRELEKCAASIPQKGGGGRVRMLTMGWAVPVPTATACDEWRRVHPQRRPFPLPVPACAGSPSVWRPPSGREEARWRRQRIRRCFRLRGRRVARPTPAPARIVPSRPPRRATAATLTLLHVASAPTGIRIGMLPSHQAFTITPQGKDRVDGAKEGTCGRRQSPALGNRAPG